MSKKMVLAAALVSASLGSSVQAGPISGEFGISGSFLPMSDGLTLSGLLGANAIDFTNTGAPTTPTPGTPGNVVVTNSDGDFAGLLPVGSAGVIQDFAFGGSAFLPNFPAPPISAFEYFAGSGGGSVSVDLTNVQLVRQTDFFLELSGTTVINTPRYSSTPGSFRFTGVAGNNGNFSFASVDPVPEPASLALLGLGLAALGATRFGRKLR